jgi:hypothetical protein
VATTHIVGAEATFEWCPTGAMELLMIQELTLAIADIRTPDTLVSLMWACVNAVMLSSSRLENKIRYATGKLQCVHKIQFMLANNMIAEPKDSTPLTPKLINRNDAESVPSTSILTIYLPMIHLNVILSLSLSSKQTFLKIFPYNISI